MLLVMSLPAAPMTLSDEDGLSLSGWPRRGLRLEEGAGIVLACTDSADGNSRVPPDLGFSVETVRKWRSRFTRLGAARLADVSRSGHHSASANTSRSYAAT